MPNNPKQAASKITKAVRPNLQVSVLSIDREDQSKANLLGLFLEAERQGSGLIVIPFGFPAVRGRDSFFCKLAKQYRRTIAAARRHGRRHIARIYCPDGTIAGEYVQTHCLPGEQLVTGDRLAPLPTAIGNVGLSIGSDIYYPEVHWSLAQQGADLLIHWDVDRGVHDHFYSVISPKVRAFDCHRPLLIARPSSQVLKLVHNAEMQIAGAPMSGSVVLDQNGAALASTGFSQGVATAILRTRQHCRSEEKEVNLLLSRGLDVWKLYFNDSRRKHFKPLRRPYSPPRKPRYRKRRIRIAVVSHLYTHQLGKKDGSLLRMIREAATCGPDIVVCTEMEQECCPDSPRIAARLQSMVDVCSATGSYLIIGGIRVPKPGTPQDRTSHAWLWDRKGRMVFESAIMLYGTGTGQEYFDTDFGRIGIRLCGDVYAPELDRLFALQGADIVFNPSMSWGASGMINSELAQARAMDNGHYIVNAHLAFSDAGQRSQVIDPTGAIVAASAYFDNSVLTVDVDLDSKRGIFLPAGKRKVEASAYLAGYRSAHQSKLIPQRELLKFRRPELYHLLDSDLPDHPYTTRNRGDGCMLQPPQPTRKRPLASGNALL